MGSRAARTHSCSCAHTHSIAQRTTHSAWPLSLTRAHLHPELARVGGRVAIAGGGRDNDEDGRVVGGQVGEGHAVEAGQLRGRGRGWAWECGHARGALNRAATHTTAPPRPRPTQATATTTSSSITTTPPAPPAPSAPPARAGPCRSPQPCPSPSRTRTARGAAALVWRLLTWTRRRPTARAPPPPQPPRRGRPCVRAGRRAVQRVCCAAVRAQFMHGAACRRATASWHGPCMVCKGGHAAHAGACRRTSAAPAPPPRPPGAPPLVPPLPRLPLAAPRAAPQARLVVRRGLCPAAWRRPRAWHC